MCDIYQKGHLKKSKMLLQLQSKRESQIGVCGTTNIVTSLFIFLPFTEIPEFHEESKKVRNSTQNTFL